MIDRLNAAQNGFTAFWFSFRSPAHLDAEAVTLRIDPRKDVDAFHPYNAGKILLGDPVFLPCTPAGIMELLRRSGIDPAGKRCVVVGRSNIVGKPMALLLLAANGTVTVCHSRTVGLADLTREADILVSAVGRPNFITADMVRPGAVVIDVGMNRDASGKLVGDVDFPSVAPLCSFITPCPRRCRSHDHHHAPPKHVGCG